MEAAVVGHVECFSMITTETIESGHAMPQCMYVLHEGSQNGPAVSYARVGDHVWHVWECPSGNIVPQAACCNVELFIYEKAH